MAKCGDGWSRGFKKVTDDGVWKRTVHPLNPYLHVAVAPGTLCAPRSEVVADVTWRSVQIL